MNNGRPIYAVAVVHCAHISDATCAHACGAEWLGGVVAWPEAGELPVEGGGRDDAGHEAGEAEAGQDAGDDRRGAEHAGRAGPLLVHAPGRGEWVMRVIEGSLFQVSSRLILRQALIS